MLKTRLPRFLPALVLAAAAFPAAVCAVAAPLPDYPFVHVSGSAFVGVMPDIAALDFEIVAVDADPAAARAVIEARVADLRTLMDQLGLDPADAHVREVRQGLHKGEQPAAAPQYELRCDVHINVRNVANWPALAGGLFGKPNLDGFASSFDLSTMDQVTDALTGQAIGDARRRAEVMAAGFGRRIGPAMGATPDTLKNVSTAMGLERGDFGSERGNRDATRAEVSREELLLVQPLKLRQTVDVIFRLDSPGGRARTGR